MKFIKILLIFFVFNSCKKNDVKDIEIEVFRFDKEFALLDSNNLESKLSDWDQKLDGFHIFYFDKYLPINIKNNIKYKKDLSLFLMNPDVISFSSDISNRFIDFNKSILPELETVFGRMNYYLPSVGIPKSAITVNSFQRYGMATYGDTLIIGLDMYLGKENKHYNSYHHMNFMKQEKFLIVDALENWLNTYYHDSHNHHTFLDELIFKGKMVYLLHKLIPDYNLNDILKYSTEEMNGCEVSESIIWKEIIKQDYLYSTDFQEFHSYFNYSPFTVGFDKSPGRLGYWVGFQIVNQYMNNEDVSLQELMKSTNSQEILLKSKYKP